MVINSLFLSWSGRGTEFISPQVYGCCGLLKICWAVPVSTICPAYITAIRWAIPAATAKSWVIIRIAMPFSR
ncbi:hypothetical protein D3C81_2261940 [compost metagenome]